MRTLGALAVIILVQGADAAYAGAWLREEGKGFAAGSVTFGGKTTTVKTYLEYGLRPRTTLGADLETTTDGLTGTAGAFVVRPLGPTDRTARMSWSVGGGADWTPLALDAFVKAGVSWGRGLTWGKRSGWATVDASVKWSFGDAPATTKIDGTIGLGLTDRTKAMMQLFVSFENSDLSAKFAPSLLYQPKTRDFTVQIGVEIPSSGAGDTTFKIGLWRDF